MAVNPTHAHLVSGSHWVSPVNFDPEVTKDFDFPQPLGLISSTLRKVRYTAGATTSIDGFLRIGAALDSVGICDESLNLDWWGDDAPNRRELDLVRAVLGAGFGFTTNVYADRLLGDGVNCYEGRRAVDLLLDLGARVVAPGIVEAPDEQAQGRQLDDLAEVVTYAQSCGANVTVTLAQAGRRNFTQMLRAANAALELGITRLDLMDSTSSLGPEAMRTFIRRFRAGLCRPVPVTMHVHDDFGLGTATAIAAATAGAGPDVSVNGVTYRCGFPPLEEVVTSLEVLYGVDTGIDVSRLQWLSNLVAAEMGVPIPPLKPIVGSYAYLKHTPGDVAMALSKGVDAFPPISGCVHASVTGASVEWVWDSLSTSAMVNQLVANLGLHLDDAERRNVRQLLDEAVAALEHYPRWLTAAQAGNLVRLFAAHQGEALDRFNAVENGEAMALVEACGITDRSAAETVIRARPFPSVAALLGAAREAVDGLNLERLAATLDTRPPIGSDPGTANRSGRWSTAEERHLKPAAVTDTIGGLVKDYQSRFAMTYVVHVAPRTPEQIHDDLRQRLANDPSAEMEVARAELRAIVGDRLLKLLIELGSAAETGGTNA
jgi:isopropylmalate/homocitrate/citramalate synthase/2-oxo-4-hydroxy-4-carboxy--5-ureidoimidazoline (OHCU) decarboxylase